MTIRRLSVVALLLLGTVTTPAAAWSDRGHEAIARAALGILQDTPASAHALRAIAKIAGLPRVTAAEFARLATWPDDIKKIDVHALDGHGSDCTKPERLHAWSCAEIGEAADFVVAFHDHATWHYADVPFGADYDASGFARPNDVAATIATCLAVLEGTSRHFSRLVALRYLLHLVADVHQPLHAGDGFFDLSDAHHARFVDGKLVTRANPDGLRPDGGGNGVFFHSGSQIHRTWDDRVPHAVAGGLSVPKLARLLQETPLPSGASATTAGDYHAWAKVWVTESSRLAARVAYAPALVRFGGGAPLAAFPHVRVHLTAPGTAEDYAADAEVRRTGEAQMIKAAHRLAELLRRLRWETP